MGGRSSAATSFFVFGLVVAFFMVVIYFDLERKFLGFRYSEIMWNMVKETALSIPRMLDHLLDTVRSA